MCYTKTEHVHIVWSFFCQNAQQNASSHRRSVYVPGHCRRGLRPSGNFPTSGATETTGTTKPKPIETWCHYAACRSFNGFKGRTIQTTGLYPFRRKIIGFYICIYCFIIHIICVTVYFVLLLYQRIYTASKAALQKYQKENSQDKPTADAIGECLLAHLNCISYITNKYKFILKL